MYGQESLSLKPSHFNYTSLSFILQSLDGKMRKTMLSALAFASTVFGQTCLTTTLQTSPPSNGSKLALASYSYCGGNFNGSAYIANLDYDKMVSLYYTNAQGLSTPLAVVNFGYSSSIGDGSQW